jgi:hypothetical protein
MTDKAGLLLQMQRGSSKIQGLNISLTAKPGAAPRADNDSGKEILACRGR